MTPSDIQRILQLKFLTETNPIIQLFCIKRGIQNCLIQEIALNLKLKDQLKNKYLQQYQEPLDTPNQHDSMYQEQSEYLSNSGEIKKFKKRIRKNKNDTKNIPKNFGKAIITFVQQKQKIVRQVLQITGADYENFVNLLKQKKKNLHSIAQLRGLWLEENFQFAKEMRIISMYFLKRASLQYIFGSRICNYVGHIKYRKRFIDVLKSPKQFTYIKS